MKIDLSGKRAIVTAGASGIGKAIATALAEAGARVAICDIDRDALAEARGNAVLAAEADVGKEGDVKRFATQALETLGGIDILVNNAGVSGPTKPLEEITAEEWAHTMNVNVAGQFYCARAVIPALKAQRSGAIFNLSSIAGRLGMPLRSVYSASKYAVRGLTDALAIELGEFNIRVNAILPGMVEGPRLTRVVAEQAAAAGQSTEDYMRMMLHNVSMHAPVSPDEVAGVITFLASDHGRHISGQSIGVCGNFESYRGPMKVTA